MKDEKNKQQPPAQNTSDANDKEAATNGKDVVTTTAVHDIGEGNYTDDQGNDIVESGLGIDE